MKEKIERFIQAFKMNGEVKKKTLLIGGIAAAVIVVIVLLLCLRPSRSQVEEPVATETDATQTDISDRVEPEPIVEPDSMEKIFAAYKDVYAWIEIPGTSAILGTAEDLSYPVTQHPTDRLFYLDHDLDGNKSKTGTLFTEASAEGKTINGRKLNDPVTVMYGHNMANRTMFGGLQTYMGKMDYSNPQYIHMYLKNDDGTVRRLTYQIVGGVQYDTSHIIYYHDFNDATVFNDFFSQLWKETDSTTNIDGANKPVAGDKVLILSVCKNGDDNHRYLVVSKLIEDTDDPTTWALTADSTSTNTAKKTTGN